MMQLLNIEWLKLKNYRTFWIMSLMFTVLLAVFYISLGLGYIDMGVQGFTIFGKASSFSGIWNDLCFFASYFVIALAILMVIITTNEFQYRTNRQNIIDGWKRIQFYHAQWLMLLAICVGVTLFVFLLGLLAGLLSGVSLSTFPENSEKLLWMFLLSVNYLGFAMTLSLFLKRSGLTIGILMFYSMIAETILHSIFLFKYHFPAGDLFLPLQASDELVPMGASQLLRMGIKADYYPEPWTFALVTLVWISLYYIIGRIKLIRSNW